MKAFQAYLKEFTASKFFYLLLTLILLILLLPHLSETAVGKICLSLVYIFVTLMIVYTVSRQHYSLWFFGILALIYMLGRLVNLYYPSEALFISDMVLFIIFCIATIKVLLNEVFITEQVKTDTILGAICIYLLIGITFGSFYQLLENINPGSFYFANDVIRPIKVFEFIYFSFITLTTTGFGDIVAISDTAKSLALLESVIGIFYIATLVAKLVGVSRKS